MSTFFVDLDTITPPTIHITGDLLHHLRDSLRLRPGDSLALNDGCGTRYRVEVTQVTSQAIDSRIIDQQTEPTPKTSPVVLGQSLIKGDKMDWVIQKATELGVELSCPSTAPTVSSGSIRNVWNINDPDGSALLGTRHNNQSDGQFPPSQIR